MTNDLEQRVNKAQSFFDYAHGNDGCGDDYATRVKEVKRSTQRMLMFIHDLIECFHDQQAEINRLKSVQLRLRPMEELKALIEEQESGYHDGSMFYAVYNRGGQVIVTLDSDKLRVGFGYYDLQDFKGWLPVDVLPTKMENEE